MGKIQCKESSKLSSIIGIMITLVLITTGCVNFSSNRKDDSTSQNNSDSTPVYYAFPDILVPIELKEIKKSSFVYEMAGVTAGILSLKGQVDRDSLISFFEINMAKDNWSVVTTFKSPTTMILYKKKNRRSVFRITEKSLNTYIEIWVTPTVSDDNTKFLDQ